MKNLSVSLYFECGIRTPLSRSPSSHLDDTDPGALSRDRGLVLVGLEIHLTNQKERDKDIAMNICYGPIDYLTAFAFVLVTGILLGLGLGWNFCSYWRRDCFGGL